MISNIKIELLSKKYNSINYIFNESYKIFDYLTEQNS